LWIEKMSVQDLTRTRRIALAAFHGAGILILLHMIIWQKEFNVLVFLMGILLLLIGFLVERTSDWKWK